MDKKAKWIFADRDIGTVSPCFSRQIKSDKKIAKATVLASAVGLYEIYVNGTRVGDALLTPGWTSYNHRVQYQKYDITHLLYNGNNTVSMLCGKGWAVGEIGRFLTPCVYAEHISAIAQISIEYEDGTKQDIFTDSTWDCSTSHILDSEIYHGEIIDLTSEVQYIGKAAEETLDFPLVLQEGNYVREQIKLPLKEIITTPKGETVLDFGQNISGYVQFKTNGKKGEKIIISHAEVLDIDGNFYTENMRGARNKNIYVLDGTQNVFKPHFCFQGFRYVRLDEYPEDLLDRAEICAIAIHTDMERTGSFNCGHEGINQLYQNIIWGQRDNFVDIPTDCPQRDERLGWTADAQVFCRTACINFNSESFFDKWLCDLGLEQGEDGRIYRFAPFAAKEYGGRISAGWSDAAVICPWEIYRAYGNTEILKKHFPMMKRWIEYVHCFGDEEFLWIGGDHYGDWLALDAGEEQRFGATQTDLIASAYFAYTTSLMIKICRVIGEDSSHYEWLNKSIRKAFREAFMQDGMPIVYPKGDAFSTNRPVKAITQTSLALILYFKLYEECEREALAARLVSLIKENDDKMSTGFIGTPYLLHALSNNGYTDVAYSLLLSEKCPSWLYSVNKGATTVWEHWDGIKSDGSFWSPSMNSFNHYAYGAVFDWMFENIGGIKICDDGAGYSHVKISPKPNKDLKFAECGIATTHGYLGVSWTYTKNFAEIKITVPQGIKADVDISHINTCLEDGEHTIKVII